MTIDISLINRAADTRANQPLANAVKGGTLFSVTDENGNLERSNGTVWAKWGPQHRAIVKAADESVSASTTLQDDNHLLFAIAVNETWIARFVLYILSASANPDFKYTIAVPAGATGKFFENAAGTVQAFAAPVSLALSAATDKVLIVDVSVTNAGTAGDVKLQWAQDTSDATATVVKAFSSLVAFKQ